MSNSELFEARLRLALVPGLGPVLTRRLEEALGDPITICTASPSQLAGIRGIGRQRAEQIRRHMDELDIAAEQQRIAQAGATVLAIDDPAYPALLKHIPDPPPVLFVRGALQRQDSLGLAVVGARRCTHYGREQAARLSGLCAQAGLSIISGGARGIDAAAHQAALRADGRTIAVLGSGLSRPYPPEHRELFDEIASGGGAVVSEFPMNTPPLAENFPRRNRIISGLSIGVLVVEAAARSGALITARLAAEEHHREVLAVPGRVDSMSSAGCHKIIREGWATLVTGPGDILDALGEAGRTLKAAMNEQADAASDSAAETSAPTPDGEAGRVLEAIGHEPTEVDHVCAETGLSIGTVQSHLMRLELSGIVRRQPGNRVARR